MADNAKGNAASNEADVWASAPDTVLIPYLSAEMKAALVNERTVVYVTSMVYDANGRYGPRFIATLIAPDGNGYHLGMQLSPGALLKPPSPSPRDNTNNWIRQIIKKGEADRVAVTLCKRGNAYYLDKPGADSERDGDYAEATPAPDSGATDEPPF